MGRTSGHSAACVASNPWLVSENEEHFAIPRFPSFGLYWSAKTLLKVRAMEKSRNITETSGDRALPLPACSAATPPATLCMIQYFTMSCRPPLEQPVFTQDVTICLILEARDLAVSLPADKPASLVCCRCV